VLLLIPCGNEMMGRSYLALYLLDIGGLLYCAALPGGSETCFIEISRTSRT